MIGAFAVVIAVAGATVLAVAFGVNRMRPGRFAPSELSPGAFADGSPIAVRVPPASFPPDSNMPPMKEALVCGSIEDKDFSPARDLVFVDDPRVWWESDTDKTDDEDDHSMHRDLEMPFRRLVELVCSRRGLLKVHDSYRPQSVHKSVSLHKEGRAIDLTCDEIGLENLAKLAWAAGFDFVLYETPSNGGDHVHCSVRRRGYVQPWPDRKKAGK